MIWSVYRSTGADPVKFNEDFFNLVVRRFPAKFNVIITGDFNLNLFDPLKLIYIDIFIANMLGYDFYHDVTVPAKMNENSPITPYSLIDQLWVNFKSGFHHDTGVVLLPLTDHYAIHFMFKTGCFGISRVLKS